MRRLPIASPLLTVTLVLSSLPALGQVAPDDGAIVLDDDDEVVAAEEDDEVVVAEEDDEVVVAEEDDEVVVAEEDDEVVVAEEDDEVVTTEDEAVFAGDSGTEAQDAALGDAADLYEPGEEPWRPAPPGKAVIWGRLVDKASGEPALEAQVRVIGSPHEVFTDFDGYYRLEVPPGRYDIEVFYEMYEPIQLKGVAAQVGKVQRQDFGLTAQVGAVEEVIIEDTAETQTVAGLAIKRQRAVASGDAIGREEISKGTDSNAAEAAQRVVGANIVGGRFVYVRGLGERYANSLLHGYPLPSPEPDRAAVPLDVFPAAVIDSLTIVKTFTPDMPGDFAGGSVQIETRSVPKEPLLKLTLSSGANTQSTFQRRMAYPGGKTDFLGFDDGTRALPASVPTDWPLRKNAPMPGGGTAGDADLDPFLSVLNTPMSPRESGTPPNHGFGVVAGNTWTTKKGQRVGVLASLNYSRKFEQYDDMVLRTFWPLGTDPRGYADRVDYVVDQSVETVRWGAFGKVSYLPSAEHKITLTGLHSQLADDQASLYLGPDKNLNLNVAATQLSWVERGVTFGLLSGEHELTALNRAELSWDASIARAFRNQPDRRDTVFNYNASRDFWSYVDGSESGRHFFANQAEDSYGGKLDWLQPIVRGKKTDVSAKLGGLINVKERAFSARRFAYRTRPPTSQEDLIRLTCQTETFDLSCPDQVLDGANLDRFYMQEGTLDGDFYDAHLKVYAGYAMLDLDFSKRLRVAVGPRIEATDQSIRPRDFGGNALPDKSAQLDAVNLLPAVSAIFSATEQLKTRASYSRTLARPQLRELAPFAFADFWGGYLQTGFPDLELTQIDNFDTRLEFYPSLTEILAASVFYKSFTNPIEILLIPSGTTTTLSYRNAPSANVIGLELEARKNLGFIAEALGPFSIITNLTLSRSRTDLPPSTFLTSRSRPLINQAPWVYNLTLDYTSDFGLEARLAYNINGLTLKEVGTQGVPDTYAHPRHVLDLTISQKFLEHWIAELQVENITNDDVLWTQGAEVDPEDIQLQYTRGTTFSLQIGYEL